MFYIFFYFFKLNKFNLKVYCFKILNMNFPYTNGFFSIDSTNGFLPIKDPLQKLPDKYNDIQSIIDLLPDLIKSDGILELSINNLNNLINFVKLETDIFIIQALYRAYTFLTSAYLLEPLLKT